MNLLTKSTVDSDIVVLRETFSRNGYLYFESFFNIAKIENARQIVLAVLAKQGWIADEDDRAHPLEPINRIGSPSFYACLQELMTKEDLHLLAYDEQLLLLLESMLGQEVFAHPRKMVRLAYPYEMNPHDLIPPHQDIYYVKGERDTFTVWMPLGNYPPVHGGLSVLEASHRVGLFPVRANDDGRFNCTASDLDLDESSWKTANYRMGDVLIMHSLTLHAGGRNYSDNFRISIDCRYSAQYGFINKEQLLPPYHPHLKSWDKIVHMWSNKILFETPSGMLVEDVNASVTDALSRKSIFE